MSPFIEKMSNVVQKNNSLICIGLDPDPDKFPEHIKGTEHDIITFNRAIIEQTSDLACAYKLNMAFYEVQGPRGLEALEATMHAIPEDVVIIGDAKRGDIGNTARMYAKSLFEYYRFDAVTVNPYQGSDAIQPFLDYKDHGVFVLCLTSNPSASEFQLLDTADGQSVYLKVAQAANGWNKNGNVGLVVGATNAESLGDIRAVVGDMPLLVPGIGAQGGDLNMVMEHGLNNRREGVLVNSSRGVLYASSGVDFADAARRAADSLREQINSLR